MGKQRKVWLIVVGLAWLLVAAGCGGSDPVGEDAAATTVAPVTDDGDVTTEESPPISTVTEPPPTSLEPASGNPDDNDDDDALPEETVEAGPRAQRVQVLFEDYADDAVTGYEVDDGGSKQLVYSHNSSFPLEDRIHANGWVGANRSVLLSNESEIGLWDPEAGVFATMSCEGCSYPGGDEQTVVVVDPGGQIIRTFSANTLDPIGELAIDLDSRTSTADGSFFRILAVHGAKALILHSDIDEQTNWGGPHPVWWVDLDTGDADLVVSADTQAGLATHAQSNDGRYVALGGYADGDLCQQVDRMFTIDMETGDLTPAPQIIELGSEGGTYRVNQVLWNDDVLYAIASANWYSPYGDDNVDSCAQEVQRAVYRLNGSQWELVDHGPIERVWPVGPEGGHKMVVVGGNDVYLERDGEAEKLTDIGYAIDGTSPQVEVDLTSPHPPEPVRVAIDEIRTAIGDGDIDALIAIAERNPDFAFSFGADGDVRDYWSGLDPSPWLTKLLDRPIERLDDEWHLRDLPTVFCRTGFDADGLWLFAICGD